MALFRDITGVNDFDRNSSNIVWLIVGDYNFRERDKNGSMVKINIS